jgi:protease-4
MSMTSDQIIDRRRLRRKLSFWRVAAFLAAAVLLVALFVSASDGIPGLVEPQIARVSISGFIADNRERIELIDKLAKTSAVKGVILDISSPGGSTTGGESLYEAVRRLADAKPTVATLGTIGTSAAYMTAIAADHIVARRTSITGSIGVLFQLPEVSELMDTVGVNVEEIKSGPLKAEPSPYKPASEEAKAVVAGVVRDSFDWFVDIVAERRDLSRGDVLVLADGRIYSGRQALEASLIDGIGGEEAAIAWLGTRGVDTRLPVRDWDPDDRSSGWFFSVDRLALWLAGKIGFGPDLGGPALLERVLPESLKLDGLISVWQASSGGQDQPAEGAAR